MQELFRDDRFVVIDKPYGMPVHAGPHGRISVEDHFAALSRRRTGPWLAHRLDAETAGCLVIALRRAALLEAQACFAAGHAEKTYWAVVHGRPKTHSGTIDLALRKHTTKAHGWRMLADPAGDPAITDFRVLAQSGDHTWLELHPRSGRTHQIRIHCASIGCPLLGDTRYGGPPGKLQLLARAIHLRLTPPLAATAPVPEHMQAFLADLL